MTDQRLFEILGKNRDELIEDFAEYIAETDSDDYVEEYAEILYDGIDSKFDGCGHSMYEWAAIRTGINKLTRAIVCDARWAAMEMSREAREEEREFREAKQGQY